MSLLLVMQVLGSASEAQVVFTSENKDVVGVVLTLGAQNNFRGV